MITRDDVAKIADVSTATVSRVVNNYAHVRPEVRQKVLRVIEMLKYEPNISARNLKTNNTKNIIYLVQSLSNTYFTDIYKGISKISNEYGYVTSIYKNEPKENLLETLMSHKVDGIILSCPLSKKESKLLKESKIPYIYMNTASTNVSEHSINIDIPKATENAMDYLYKNGHRSIGLITDKNSITNERIIGYKKALDKYKIPFCPSYIKCFKGNEYSYQEGYDVMNKFISEGTKVTAIIGNNDLITIGAMRAAYEAKLMIPDNISFIGFDDSPVSNFTIPSLTTVKLFQFQQGEVASKMLFDLINNTIIDKIQIKTEFIIRESVKDIK